MRERDWLVLRCVCYTARRRPAPRLAAAGLPEFKRSGGVGRKFRGACVRAWVSEKAGRKAGPEGILSDARGCREGVGAGWDGGMSIA